MTVIVTPLANNENIYSWETKLNLIVDALANVVVSTDSNTAAGNAAITGTFTSNSLVTTVFTANNVTSNNIISTSANTATLEVTSVLTTANLTATNISTEAVVANTANINTITSNISFSKAVSMTNTLTVTGDFYQQDTLTFSNTTTLSSVSANLLYSFSTASFRGGKLLVVVSNSTTNNYMQEEIGILHDDTSVLFNQYGRLTSNNVTGAFSANINSGEVRVYYSPAAASNTTVKYTQTLI